MIVLDTHVLIWDALAPDRLSNSAEQAITFANQQDGAIICDISLWEIAMLLEKGRVQVDIDTVGFINLLLQANKINVQAITPQIVSIAVKLPAEITKDPADRLIAATALSNDIPLVTADTNLQDSSLITTLW